MRSTQTPKRRAVRTVLLLLILAVAVPSFGFASPTPATDHGFFDNFESYGTGALPAFRTSDPWQIAGGSWNVVTQSGQDAPIVGTANHILVQSANAVTPNDAIAFVRAMDFRELTVQVTAAFTSIANQQPLTDPTINSTLCIAFRSPITDGIADRDDLYLFCAIVTGVQPWSPTGKGYELFKRVGRSYFPLTSKLTPTWDDLFRPHDYKVVMGGGRILGFVDGRQVIDFTDLAAGDQPTPTDPFPFLPWESGAVGVRTSAASAWFDNFVAVGNDASDGRAAAVTAWSEYGNPASNSRRGFSAELSNVALREGLNAYPDTGFVYHDQDPYTDSNISPVELPGGPTMGVDLEVRGADGVTTSVARLGHVDLSFTDPGNRVTVMLQADAIESTSTATCDETHSTMSIDNGTLTIIEHGVDSSVPDKTIGPIPLNETYPENTHLKESQNPIPFTLMAHVVDKTLEPHRATVSAFRIMIPEGLVQLPVGSSSFMMPGLQIDIAQVAAGRYCP
ncbi:MAG: hypothetical protein ABR552_02915 [Actinomycetota bacterium]